MEIQKPRSLVCDISFKCSSMLSMGNHYVFWGYYIKWIVMMDQELFTIVFCVVLLGIAIYLIKTEKKNGN